MWHLAMLGKVFISHSSADKPFVRRLSNAIEASGYQTWLDEKELVPGDPLAKRISEAIDRARVVLVVVSSSSIASRWLAFELNHATDRMVKGECRVIPVVVEKVPLPPEVAGLLYADFTGDFDLPLKSVLTALEHEAHTHALNHSFWSRADMLVKAAFHGTGYVSVGGEYNDKDYEIVYVYAETDERADTTAAYESVSAYGSPARPLNDRWWDEYSSAMTNLNEVLSLVLTERPIEFATETMDSVDSRVSYKPIGWNKHTFGYAVFVDLSTAANEGEQLRLVHIARDVLQRLDQELLAKYVN